MAKLEQVLFTEVLPDTVMADEVENFKKNKNSGWARQFCRAFNYAFFEIPLKLDE